jgi:HTH-type transcriptional regulator / antitoxin HipB
MSDLKKYIYGRKKRDMRFAEGYDEGYEQFKIGVVLKHALECAGMTQEALTRRLEKECYLKDGKPGRRHQVVNA